MGYERLAVAVASLPAAEQEAELLAALVEAAAVRLGCAAAGVRRAGGPGWIARFPPESEPTPDVLIPLAPGLEFVATGKGDAGELQVLAAAAARLLDSARERARLAQKADRAARKARDVLERHRSQTLRLSELRGELDDAQQKHLVLSERNRIAQDLHDRAAQTNFLLALKLDRLMSDLAPEDPLRPELERLRALAVQAAAQTREAIYALRAPELAEGGLQGGLRRLLRAAEADGFTARLTVTGTPRPLPPEVEDALFKVGQEALTNARKHSRGTAIIVALRFEPEMVTLVVQDNGVGIAKGAEIERPERFGVRGMRERVSALGGELCLVPGDEGGLLVRATIPLKGAINHGDTHSYRRRP